MSRPEDTVITYEESDYIPSNPRTIVGRWWATLDPFERVLYRGLAATGLGLAALGAAPGQTWPLALLVPGAVITFLGVFAFVVSMVRPSGG